MSWECTLGREFSYRTMMGRSVEGCGERQNTIRLNSDSGDITPKDLHAGRRKRPKHGSNGSQSTRESTGWLVATEPPDVHPKSIGRDSAGKARANTRRHVPCRDPPSGLPEFTD